MRTPLLLALTLLASLAGTSAGRAQEEVDKAKAGSFDKRMFAGPLGQKTSYACFVRTYDAEHLARHPKQKVAAMKVLVQAEYAPEDKITNYSFRLGVKYRHRPGNFDSSGSCSHVIAEDAGNEIRYGCGVDCEGGGIMWRCRRTTNQPSSASKEFASGGTTSRTTMPRTSWWPALTTRSFGSTALKRANAPRW